MHDPIHPDPQVRRLLAQAHLFDDPAAYRAGVLDTWELLRAAARTREVRAAS